MRKLNRSDNMNYGNKLKELREYNNISQYKLADDLGISRSSYNQFEQQYDIIPIKRLDDLALYFDVSIDYILDLTPNTKYKNMNSINLNISKIRLKELRKENKLTQEKLANILHTNRSVLANYERGRNIIATPFLYDICKKYHISADYLLGRIDSPKYY